MSCHGWGVGDKCEANAPIDFGTGIVVAAGDSGTVTSVRRHAHEMTVYWDRLGRKLDLDHQQIHSLAKRETDTGSLQALA